MKLTTTLVRSMAAAAGALVMASVLSAGSAQAAVTMDSCSKADDLADGVYAAALANPRLYPGPNDARDAARAAFTRRILSEAASGTPYRGDGKGPGEYRSAIGHCHAVAYSPSGPWV